MTLLSETLACLSNHYISKNYQVATRATKLAGDFSVEFRSLLGLGCCSHIRVMPAALLIKQKSSCRAAVAVTCRFLSAESDFEVT